MRLVTAAWVLGVAAVGVAAIRCLVLFSAEAVAGGVWASGAGGFVAFALASAVRGPPLVPGTPCVLAGGAPFPRRVPAARAVG